MTLERHDIPSLGWPTMLQTAIDFRQRPLDFIEHLTRNYGKLVRFQLGPFASYLLTDPEQVADVMSRTDLFYKDKITRTVVRPLFGDGLVLVDGELHKKNRKLIAPAFYHSRIKLYAEAMSSYTQKMLSGWTDGQEILLEHKMIELTLYIITKTMFNAELEATPDLLATLETMMVTLGGKLREPIPLPLNLPTKNNRQLRRTFRMLDNLIFQIIREHRASGEDQRNLLSILLSAVDENGNRFTDQQIRDEAMLIFFGGHETTAHLLTWAFYLLDKYPETRVRLEEEIDTILQGRMPAIDDLAHLPYTAMIIKETLRLYPPVWVTNREPIADVMIGGHLIKKGSLLFVSPYLNQRDSAFYDKPDEFDPERFRDNAERKWPAFRYFPFGGGSRICIGQEYATAESMLVLASIASRFRLERLDEKDVKARIAATLRPDSAIPMRLCLRNSALPFQPVEQHHALRASAEIEALSADQTHPSGRCPVEH